MVQRAFLLLSVVSFVCVSQNSFAGKSKERPDGSSMTLTFQTPKGDIPELKQPIEVLAWSFGMSHESSSEDGKKAGPAKFRMQNLSLTKYVGLESPKLMSLLAKQQEFPTAVLKTTGSNGSAITLTMKKAILTSVSTGGSGGEQRFTENITLGFDEVQVENSETDKSGKVTKSVEVIKAN